MLKRSKAGSDADRIYLKEKSEWVRVKQTRAQSSLEFLFTAAFMVLVMVLCMVINFQSSQDSSALSAYAESMRICHAVASQISAVDAAGDGASAVLRRPASLADMNYTILVIGINRSISVNYGSQGTGCLFSTSNISNGSSSSFSITQDSLVRNVNGGVLVG